MSNRGGKREGSGRKKGARNRRTVEFLKKAAAAGYEDPVEFLLSVVADTEADLDLRLRAAMGAAPYVRAKLAPREADPEPPANEEGIGFQIPDLRKVNE
jgi:hypothetical protein